MYSSVLRLKAAIQQISLINSLEERGKLLTAKKNYMS